MTLNEPQRHGDTETKKNSHEKHEKSVEDISKPVL